MPMMVEMEEGMEVMEAIARGQAIHLDVYHQTYPFKAANYCLTLLDHPCKLLIYQIPDTTSFKTKG